MSKANLLIEQSHLLIERFYHFAALQIAVHFLTAKGNRVDPRQNTHTNPECDKFKRQTLLFQAGFGVNGYVPLPSCIHPQAIASGTPGQVSLSDSPHYPSPNK